MNNPDKIGTHESTCNINQNGLSNCENTTSLYISDVRSILITSQEKLLMVGLQSGHVQVVREKQPGRYLCFVSVQIYTLNARFLRKRFINRLLKVGF
jgi:hypothetical protein